MKPIVKRLLLTLFLAAVACPYAQGQATPTPDFRDLRGYIRWLNSSKSPEAARIRKEIADGPADLARERSAARAAGLPLTFQELNSPVITPEQNAAIEYRQIMALRKKRPIAPEVYNIALDLGRNHPATSAEMAATRKILAERREILQLIHQAADKPSCNFGHDPAKWVTDSFPEWAELRDAARLIRIESMVLALDGKFEEAVRNQARGFRLAEHAAAQPALIPYLVGIAIEAISEAGMQQILFLAGPNATVSNLVQRTMQEKRSHFNLASTLKGEMVQYLGYMTDLRTGDPETLTGLTDTGEAPAKPVRQRYSQEEQLFIKKIQPATEAALIHGFRQLIEAAGSPYPVRHSRMVQVGEGSNDEKDPVRTLSDIFLPVFAGSADREGITMARQNALIASAALLGWRANHNSFPEKLEEALPGLPRDPFTGRFISYRREGEGFVVYSVGPEGKFDGGKPGMARNNQQVYIRYPGTVTGGKGNSPVAPAPFDLSAGRSAIRTQRFVVARNAREFAALLEEHQPGGGVPPAPIDFSKYDVVAYFAGAKPTGGYSVRIEDIARANGSAEVHITLLKPAPGTITIQAFTSPCAMRAVEKLPEQVTHTVTEKIR
jgi:hypothetical protein